MRNVLRITLATCLLLVDLVALANAGVYWEETFENHLNNGFTPSRDQTQWDTTACTGGFWGGTPPYIDGCNAQISTTVARGGTHSLKSHYDPACGMVGEPGSHGCGRFFDRYYPSSDEIWFRFYIYFVNWATFNLAPSKHMLFSPENLNPNFWLVFNHDSREMALAPQNVQDCIELGSNCYSTTVMYPNVASFPLNDNRWYCVEGNLKLNTPGQPDGRAQIFVDGTKTLDWPNYRFRGPNVNNPSNNSSTAQFQYVRHYTQYGQGDKYIDDLAVGDTRIGCGGIAPLPPTPSAPASLNLQ
jgi:hypothetical protein